MNGVEPWRHSYLAHISALLTFAALCIVHVNPQPFSIPHSWMVPLFFMAVQSIAIWLSWTRLLKSMRPVPITSKGDLAKCMSLGVDSIFSSVPYIIRMRPTELYLQQQAASIFAGIRAGQPIAPMRAVHELYKHPSLANSMWVIAIILVVFVVVGEFPSFAQAIGDILPIKIFVIWISACLASSVIALLLLSSRISKISEV
jgi:hypothetical protein